MGSSSQGHVTLHIGPEGGTLSIANDIVKLQIPPDALSEQRLIKLSIVSPETDHPPLDNKFIIAPVVRLEPDGLMFSKPVTLTAKHAAVDLNITNLEVWTKSTG